MTAILIKLSSTQAEELAAAFPGQMAEQGITLERDGLHVPTPEQALRLARSIRGDYQPARSGGREDTPPSRRRSMMRLADALGAAASES